VSNDNPLWHRWPFKGWREDDAAAVLALFAWTIVIGTLVIVAAVLLP
jgi:hypothetical protein